MIYTRIFRFWLFSLSCVSLLPQAYAYDNLRQEEVARRGAQLMPFSLEKTLHEFTKTPDGGVQRVIVRNAEDSEQIPLIRQHLAQLAQQFALGDFSGPESIHGSQMPGLQTLKTAKPGSLQIQYQEDALGASLTFHSVEPRVINAVHDWFSAQVHDHGPDAEMHRMHHQ